MNFEILAGKSFSKTIDAKRFGLVQQCDENSRRRLLAVLSQFALGVRYVASEAGAARSFNQDLASSMNQ